MSASTNRWLKFFVDSDPNPYYKTNLKPKPNSNLDCAKVNYEHKFLLKWSAVVLQLISKLWSHNEDYSLCRVSFSFLCYCSREGLTESMVWCNTELLQIASKFCSFYFRVFKMVRIFHYATTQVGQQSSSHNTNMPKMNCSSKHPVFPQKLFNLGLWTWYPKFLHIFWGCHSQSDLIAKWT